MIRLINRFKGARISIWSSLATFLMIMPSSSYADNLDARVDFVMSVLAEGRYQPKVNFSSRFSGLTLCKYARQFSGVDLFPGVCDDLDEKKLKKTLAAKVCDYGDAQSMAACFRRLSGLEQAAAVATTRFILSKQSVPEIEKVDLLNLDYAQQICDLDASWNGGTKIYESLAWSSCYASMMAQHRYALAGIAWAVQR